jgi:uncharacterized membrane protein YuzA (DUF378 family)
MHKCNCGCGCGPSMVASALVIVGGLNWGLAGIGMLSHMNLNVVNLILGQWPVVEAIVYVLVGVATIGVLIGCKCAKCMKCASCSDCKGGVCKTDAPKMEGDKKMM